MSYDNTNRLALWANDKSVNVNTKTISEQKAIYQYIVKNKARRLTT